MSKVFQTRTRNAATASLAPPIAHDALRSPGKPLDAATRAMMEPRFGHDFSQVRVHTDEQAAQAAQSVNAVAYTVGRDVVFGAGQYAPQTAAGQRVLAHELTHVAQQANAGSPALSQLAVGPTDDSYEREAERSASHIVGGANRAPGNFTAAPPTIQRQTKEDPAKKKETTQPPPQKVPPKKVDEAKKEAEKEEEGVQVSTKAGGTFETNKKETSGGAKIETEIEKEGVGSISGSIAGKRASETTPEGGKEASSSVEFGVEAKIPVGALLLGEERRKKIAPFVVLKEVGVEGSFELKRPDATGRSTRALAGELTVQVIGAEWEKVKVGKGLLDVGVGLAGVGKIEGEREDDKWNPKYEVGGALKGEAKYRPKAEGPWFISVEGSAKLTTTKEGGADFQPGAFTWSVGAGVGYTFGGGEKKKP